MAQAMTLRVSRGFKLGTRLSDIEVPPELEVRKTSGLPWFDIALGSAESDIKKGDSGFTPTTTLLLTGMPGAGKSTLARQLASSMAAAGHVVLYNGTEESLLQVRKASRRLKLKNESAILMGEEVMLPKLLEYLDALKKDPKNKGKQIVLIQDSLATIDDGKYMTTDGKSRGTTSNTPVHCIEMIVDWMQANFGIGIIIGQVTKSGDFAGKQTIMHAVDARMHLRYEENEKSDVYGCLLAEVPKHRWGCNGMTMVLGMTETGIEERGRIQRPGFSNGAAATTDA